tara:strand:- start:324 stop:1010 length:687 start_codon:yes stop_codon:yes gene_type:complete
MNINNLKIYNADCMAIMKNYPDDYFDLAVVDPPYGIGTETGQRNAVSRRGSRAAAKWKNPTGQNYRAFDDSKPPKEGYFIELQRVSKNQIIWGGNYFTEFMKPSKGWIVWNKKADIKEHLSMCELAWSSFNKKCNMFEFLWAGFKKAIQEKRIHPTQKPIALYKWIYANYAEAGQKILDTHLGSGSNAIAAHYADMGEFVGCELDEEYYTAACKRIENETAQLTLGFE